MRTALGHSPTINNWLGASNMYSIVFRPYLGSLVEITTIFGMGMDGLKHDKKQPIFTHCLGSLCFRCFSPKTLQIRAPKQPSSMRFDKSCGRFEVPCNEATRSRLDACGHPWGMWLPYGNSTYIAIWNITMFNR